MGFIIALILSWIVGYLLAIMLLMNEDASIKTKVATLLSTLGVFSFAMTLMFSYMQVEKGYVKYLTLFGSVVEDAAYGEGPHLVNPMADSHTFKIQEVRYKYEPNEQDDGSNVAISKDGVSMDIQATFPVILNPKIAWNIGRRLGRKGYHEMMRQSAYAAVRTTMSRYDWEEAITNQQKFSLDLGDTYEASVQENLKRLGMTEQEAQTAVTFIPPKIRRMVPPKRIRQAINEESAAKRDLNRQKTLTEIAKEEANRRANEGMGVKKMFSELPSQYSTDQMSSIIRALATKTRAEALVKAVENGSVNTIVISGGSGNDNTPVPAITAK